jgi:YHS domain-containing protein
MKRIVENILYEFAGLLLLIIMSCNHQPKKEVKYVSPAIANKNLSHSKFTVNDVDNKLDPSCMMPLAAGIGDTLHYQGLVLGFCSAECKKEFLKDPKGNLALAQVKKNIKK